MNTPRRFKLFPQEAHWWSANDYGHVVDTTQAIGAKTVLEFGPGSSTLSLIEGGALSIDACEDNEHWAKVHEERIAKRFPSIVRIVPYVWNDPLTIKAIEGRSYDMALIDGPHGTPARPAVLRYCLTRCKSVLMCCEDYYGRGLREEARVIAMRYGRSFTVTETGPLAGSFALIQ